MRPTESTIDPDAAKYRTALRDALVERLATSVNAPRPAAVPSRPIAFNTEMVGALLAGRKTQTRRPPSNRAPKVGDRLWVAERFAPADEADESAGYRYFADDPRAAVARWRPGRFMPRRAGRLMLEVTAVRREAVDEISPEDAAAEGCPAGVEPVAWFRGVWQSIYAGGANDWSNRPAVVAITFRLLQSARPPL